VKRPGGSLLVSIALHVVLGAGLIWVLGIPTSFHDWMGLTPPPKEPTEHIAYVALPSAGGGAAGQRTTEPSTGAPAPAPRLRAPSAIPSTVPAPTQGEAVPSGESAAGGTGTGGGGTGQGLTQGISPSFEDPRVWVPPGEVRSAPKTSTQRLDSALASTLRTHQDSMNALAAARGRDPGDWTFEKGGKKWGMDRNKIYIGDHSIPTAILALLPLNTGSNPIKNREERMLNSQRVEIMEQAQRAMNEEEFREAVKKIRERKEREHQAELARKKAAEKANAAGEQPIP
jgi:hypothetical protein